MINPFSVILNEVKDLGLRQYAQILRYAQNDRKKTKDGKQKP
jgi:hypothetical protein